jgi:putative colanic acid biosynthesis UDP-glucose lipid carrier transferase
LLPEKTFEGAVSVQEQFAEVREALPVPFGLTHPLRAQARIARPVRRPRTAKRLLDLMIALPVLFLIAPLLIAVILLIKLDSRGPVLFRQKRLGLNGRQFGIFKFRTMHVVEDGEAVVQATPGDTRITRIGSFLRASSIDELPQLLNVIAGDMSLVGPRPHAIAHDLHYAMLIPEYAQRQTVKPGITGWAQVNGYRGGTPTLDLMQRRVDFDLWYADHGSILLDFLILVRTPVELLRNRDVY